MSKKYGHKLYGKFFAYFLMDFSTMTLGVLVGIILLFLGMIPNSESDFAALGGTLLLAGIISIIPTIWMTLWLNHRVPKGRRFKTWWEAWWLGFKIAWKIALAVTLICLPLAFKIHTDVNSSNSGLQDGQWVYGDNGNRYQVIDNGNQVIDEQGNWHRVWIYDAGYPFIDVDGERVYLR